MLLLIKVLALMVMPAEAYMPNNDRDADSSWALFLERLHYDAKSLIQASYYSEPSSSQWAQNPAVYLPRYNALLSLRPNLHYHHEKLTLSLKPRFDAQYQENENIDGDHNGMDDNRIYVNEWLARFMLTQKLFISYGRENLQWGGAYLFSPSNPFFTDNGRRNPKKEVEGMDFARLVLIPNMTWTLSFIVHTDEGEQELREPFETAYAIKLDYNAAQYYASAIGTYREDFGSRIGLYGGWTCSDALLIYAEGAIGEQRAMIFPLRADDFSNSDALEDQFESDRWTGSILAGAAYTLTSGPTLTAEFLYSGMGGTLDEHNAVLLPSKRSADYTFFENKNYLLVQYTHNDIAEVWDLVLRATYGLDDASGMLIAIAEYDLSDHLILYAIGTLNFGPEGTEYGQQLDHHVTVGIEYSY